MFTTTLASNAPFPLYVVCQQRFGFSPTTLTYVFSSYAVGVIVVLVLVGRLSDQIGRRRVIIPALILLATGPLLFGILVQYAPWPLRLPFVVEVALVTATVTLTRTVPETVKRGPSVRWRVQKPAVPRPIRRAFVAATLALAVSWGVGALYAALSPSIDLQLLRVRSHAAAGAVLAAFFGLGGVAQTLFRAWPARSRWSPELAHSQAAWRSSHVASPTAQWRSSSPGRFSLVPVAGWTSWGAWPFNQVGPPQRRAEVLSAYNIVGYVALSVPIVGGAIAGRWGRRGRARSSLPWLSRCPPSLSGPP